MGTKRFDVSDYRPKSPEKVVKPKERYTPGTPHCQKIQELRGQLRLF